MKNFSKIKFNHRNLGAMIRCKSDTLKIVLIKLITICKCKVSAHFIFELEIVLVRLQKIQSKQGFKGLTLYLKTCSIALQQYSAGFILKDIGSPNKIRISRTKSGLPRLIPSSHRFIIRNGTDLQKANLIKYWLSIFYLYRLLSFPSKGDISSIIKPNKESLYMSINWEGYAQLFIKSLGYRTLNPFDTLLSYRRPFSDISTASPNRHSGKDDNDNYSLHASHPASVLNSIVALKSKPKLRSDLIRFNIILDQDHINNMIQSPFDVLDVSDVMMFHPGNPHIVGKLGFKIEPAGKVRVFAMVDPTSNWSLEALHKYIFYAILAKLITDGTFDQIKPAKRLLNRNSTGLYSVDLSSATDRLPIKIQHILLSQLFNSEFADLWQSIMIGRGYKMTVPKEIRDIKNGFVSKTIFYAVGQPMGALSSWAMLALTHHFIVQISAWRSGICKPGKLYTNYALLGDDLVLGDFIVFKEYSKIIQKLQVKLSLAKSILSSHSSGLEFAKKTLIKLNNIVYDVSPVSMKEFGQSLKTFSDFLAFVNKFNLSIPASLKILGYGYRVIGSCNKNYNKANLILKNLFLGSLNKLNFGVSITPNFKNQKFLQHIDSNLLWLAIYDLITIELLNLSHKINEFEALISCCFFESQLPLELRPSKSNSRVSTIRRKLRWFQFIYSYSMYRVWRDKTVPSQDTELGLSVSHLDQVRMFENKINRQTRVDNNNPTEQDIALFTLGITSQEKVNIRNSIGKVIYTRPNFSRIWESVLSKTPPHMSSERLYKIYSRSQRVIDFIIPGSYMTRWEIKDPPPQMTWARSFIKWFTLVNWEPLLDNLSKREWVRLFRLFQLTSGVPLISKFIRLDKSYKLLCKRWKPIRYSSSKDFIGVKPDINALLKLLFDISTEKSRSSFKISLFDYKTIESRENPWRMTLHNRIISLSFKIKRYIENQFKSKQI